MAESTGAEYVLHQVRESGVKLISLWFSDVTGRLKSVAVTDEQLEVALEEGVTFDGGTMLGMARKEETDLVLLPDPGSFVTLPYRDADPPVARMFCDLKQADGSFFAMDSRTVLKDAIAAARAKGFTFYVGCEVEHYYFRGSGIPLQTLDGGSYFDVTPTAQIETLRRDTVMALEELGIGVESAHHEVGPGQYEIRLQYADALTMADSVMTHRHVVKALAEGHGLLATFMPKPLPDHNGSGLHLTLSLEDEGGNAFFDSERDDKLSDVARSFVAGLLEHAPATTLVANQWVNSYKRLAPGFEAPAYMTWARTNWSDLVRVPTMRESDGPQALVEYRSPDPACNPYLAFACLLRAGLDGIERGLEPGPARASTQDPATVGKRLPETLAAAADAAERSEFLRHVLGERLVETLLDNARYEWRGYHGHVSRWELDRYLSRL